MDLILTLAARNSLKQIILFSSIPTPFMFNNQINGLRAIAVLLVVLFHLEYTFVPGGFLGVDVFLVISGYLISKSILLDVEKGKFSFLNFYIRRFKRLFPALFVTLTLTLIGGYFTLTPSNLEHLSKSALSGLYYFSNIYFFGDTGYFDSSSSEKPLLHIWSLSLEEQFYFIWPLLIVLTFTLFKKGGWWFLVILFLASLMLSNLYVDTDPSLTFYLLPFRFFEFLMGAFCIRLEKNALKSWLFDELFVLTGTTLVFLSAIFYTGRTPMPSFISLVPCGGTMLIILGKRSRYLKYVFDNPLSTIIGKTSYSIYLLHWPIIVLYKYYTLNELDAEVKLILLGTTLILAYMLWRFIENPLRYSEFKLHSLDGVWLWMPIAMGSITLVCTNIIQNQGYPERYSAEFLMTEKEITANRDKYWQGADSTHSILQGTNNKQVLVIGNSISIDLIYAFKLNGFKAKITSLQTTHFCYNFGAAPVSAIDKDTALCKAIIEQNKKIGGWNRYQAIYLMDHWPKVDIVSLEKFLLDLRQLTPAPIFVIGPKMAFTKVVPDIAQNCKSASTLAINKFAQRYVDSLRFGINSDLNWFFKDRSLHDKKIYYIDVLSMEANGTIFPIVIGKTPTLLYFDKSHFTNAGSKRFGELLKKEFSELWQVAE